MLIDFAYNFVGDDGAMDLSKIDVAKRLYRFPWIQLLNDYSAETLRCLPDNAKELLLEEMNSTTLDLGLSSDDWITTHTDASRLQVLEALFKLRESQTVNESDFIFLKPIASDEPSTLSKLAEWVYVESKLHGSVEK